MLQRNLQKFNTIKSPVYTFPSDGLHYYVKMKFVLLKTTLHLPAQHVTHNIIIVGQQNPNLDNAFWVAWTRTITGYTVCKSYLITLNDAYASDN